MTRLAMHAGAVNLAQGFPDFPPPELKEAAAAAPSPTSTSTRSPGARSPPRGHRRQDRAHFPGWTVDPEREITVTCGATEAMIAAMLGLLDPGDEVVVFEPFYENYGPDAILSGAVPRFVTLHEPDWSIDPDELAPRSASARAVIVSTRRTTRPARSSPAPSWS